jgi:hypothetical protein
MGVMEVAIRVDKHLSAAKASELILIQRRQQFHCMRSSGAYNSLRD